MSKAIAHYPGVVPIDAYHNGGFRFAGMSHRGSILCLPSGVYAWEPAEPLDVQSLAPALAAGGAMRVLILGTGARQVFPAPAVRRAFAEAGLALEPMDTGAACRTYNVLLAEGRPVGAALMAVATGAEGGGAGRGASTGAPSMNAAAEVAVIARAGEPDRYLAALLAPAPERETLLALAAFAAELARIPLRVVREPMMGEIRLEWWRTALASTEGESAGHSVADAMRATVLRHGLPAALLDDMIDARALELSAAPFADAAALQDFLWRTEGTLFALAGRAVGLGADGEAEDAYRAAGRAYGLARLLLGLPRSLPLGRIPLAETQVVAAGLSRHELLAGAGGDRVEALLQAHIAQIRASLAEARRLTRKLPLRMRVAFLPLALVEPYVRGLERQGSAALRQEVQILPLTRVWRIAAAHFLGRL